MRRREHRRQHSANTTPSPHLQFSTPLPPPPVIHPSPPTSSSPPLFPHLQFSTPLPPPPDLHPLPPPPVLHPSPPTSSSPPLSPHLQSLYLEDFDSLDTINNFEIANQNFNFFVQ